MGDLSFDEVFGTDKPKADPKKQTVDFFGGALKGLWDSTIGGVAHMGKTFAKGMIDGPDPNAPFLQRALESNPMFRPALGIKAVGSEMWEGIEGQGQRAADLAMGVERGSDGNISEVGEAHPWAAAAQVVPFVGPPAAEAILDPSASNIGKVVGNVAGTAVPLAVGKVKGARAAKAAEVAKKAKFESEVAKQNQIFDESLTAERRTVGRDPMNVTAGEGKVVQTAPNGNFVEYPDGTRAFIPNEAPPAAAPAPPSGNPVPGRPDGTLLMPGDKVKISASMRGPNAPKTGVVQKFENGMAVVELADGSTAFLDPKTLMTKVHRGPKKSGSSKASAPPPAAPPAAPPASPPKAPPAAPVVTPDRTATLNLPDDFLTLGQEAKGTAHPFIAQLEATLAKTASGRPAFVKLKEAQNATLIKAGEDLAESFSGGKGGTRTAVGKDLTADIAAAREGAFSVADKALEEVKSKHGSSMVDTGSLKAWAKNELDRLGPVEEMIGNQHGEVRTMLETIVENPNKQMTFAEAIDLRSALIAKGRKLTREGTEPRGGMVKQLTKTFDESMDNTAKAGGFDSAWRDANRLWKDARDTFDRSFLKTISKKDPALISKALTKEMATPDNLALVKSKVSKATWQKVRGRLLEDALSSATKGGEVQGASLRKWYDSLGAEKRAVIFDQADAASINKFIEAAEAVGLHDVQGFGSWVDRVVTLGTGAATAIAAPGKLTAKAVVSGAAGFMGAKGGMRLMSRVLADPVKSRRYAGFMKDTKGVMKDLAKGVKPAPYAMQRFRQLQSQIQKDIEDLDMDDVFKE